MLNMSLMALCGLVVVALVYFFFVTRGAAQQAAARAEFEEIVALKQKRTQEVDAELAQRIVVGASVDQAIGDYQKNRAGILPGEHGEHPWAWTGDDLEAWKKRELRRRLEEVNRRILLPAVVTSLLAIALTTAAIIIYYQFMAAQPQTLVPSLGSSPPQFSAPLPLPHPVNPGQSFQPTTPADATPALPPNAVEPADPTTPASSNQP